LLVDLMLPGYRRIDLISQINATHPEMHILALSPGDIPHDRVILAIRAGALGFITRDTNLEEALEAFHQVNQGQHWLPLEDTYEVLSEAAGELTVTEQDRRSRLTQVVLGIIPLTGMIAAITAYLWRHYWGQIGVRVVDLRIVDDHWHFRSSVVHQIVGERHRSVDRKRSPLHCRVGG
jgi:DNA-binding response OmpR family regulator